MTWRAVYCKSRSQPQRPSPVVGRARGEQFVCTDARRGGFPTAGVCLTPGLGLHRFFGAHAFTNGDGSSGLHWATARGRFAKA